MEQPGLLALIMVSLATLVFLVIWMIFFNLLYGTVAIISLALPDEGHENEKLD